MIGKKVKFKDANLDLIQTGTIVDKVNVPQRFQVSVDHETVNVSTFQTVAIDCYLIKPENLPLQIVDIEDVIDFCD